MQLNELKRIDHDELVSNEEHWALYHDFYEMFARLDTREDLLEKYKKFLKVMKNPKGKDALTFFYRIRRDQIDKKFSWHKVRESLNEFQRGEDPTDALGVGEGRYRHAKQHTKSWKILRYILDAGKEGRSFTEIQYYIWTELDGKDPDDFYNQRSFNWGKDKLGKPPYTGPRASRGHWSTNLNRILYKWAHKNADGRWVISEMPEYNDLLYPKY